MSVPFQCPFCGVACGLLWEEGRVRGDKKHPATRGDLCQKPVYYPRMMDSGRITVPLYRENKDGPFREISWDKAYDILSSILKSLDGEEVYFYLSGQLLTEDIYVMVKLVKGFLKTNNMDANSRLCMATPATAYRLVFGSDGPPGCYDDIDDSDTFVFVGSNAAWTHPVIYKRVLKRKHDAGAYVVVIDPLKTETAKHADMHIQLKPGTDAFLFNAVLYVLYKEGCIDKDFVSYCVEGFEETLTTVTKYAPSLVSSLCNVPLSQIIKLAELYATSKKLISFWCQGINQSSSGVATNIALMNLHLATGRVGEKGFPFALTGQPNAMGGREMGYLSHALPGYRDVRNKDHRHQVESFWGIPEGSIRDKPGPTVMEAVDLILEGKIKFLWVVATNPAVTLPSLGKVWKALRKVFLVVQDAYFNDTVSFANLVLPAAQLGEKEGTMTGSDRTITLCRRWSHPPGEARPDWQIFTQLAERLGFGKSFPYTSSEDIFNELKQLTKGRVCDISEFSYRDLPRRWGGRWLYPNGSFPTPTGKARMYPIDPVQKETTGGQMILITGRTKNQWHTMTRTGKVPQLLKGEEEPFVAINPVDADRLGLRDQDTVVLKRGRYAVRIKCRVSHHVPQGVLFSPFGYGISFGNPINLLTTDTVDPLSFQPELKFTPVEVLGCYEETSCTVRKQEEGGVP
ncbi:molybdopterin oxidoreductase [Thermocrinis albus DSM 14484]|uniref:Molybdopterin oxidoreductase n=1 Tax=Thermocrinis albus (strain DSM 14484 / JCM 11386 / HI 11/12) TaxID=638303 RepID=D3SMG9_THEAH|nr:nitrate reductase [Thermocrinis albus]ADC89949.1 molybdopterin oxidoreductase [Thermocrinis albus DSM 14484]